MLLLLLSIILVYLVFANWIQCFGKKILLVRAEPTLGCSRILQMSAKLNLRRKSFSFGYELMKKINKMKKCLLIGNFLPLVQWCLMMLVWKELSWATCNNAYGLSCDEGQQIKKSFNCSWWKQSNRFCFEQIIQPSQLYHICLIIEDINKQYIR